MTTKVQVIYDSAEKFTALYSNAGRKENMRKNFQFGLYWHCAKQICETFD